MSYDVRANTVTIVPIGPFPDVTDGFTPQIDIALACDEAEIVKHGASTVTDISAATWAAIANCRGWYNLTLTAALTDTPGSMKVIVQDDSDSLPVVNIFNVLSEHAYDLKYGTEGSGGGIMLGKFWYGTFAAVGAATITVGDDTAGNAIYVGARVMVILDSGTNAVGRSRIGTMGATRVITVDPSWGATVPSGTLVGAVWAVPQSTTSSLPAVTVPYLEALLGALDDAAADGDVTASDTMMAYMKQAITAIIVQAAAATTAQNDLDVLAGTDGATLATSQPNYAPNKVVPDAAGVAPTATEIVDEFETQSQADPTGFHVNVMEVNSVDLTGDGDGTPMGAA